MLASVKSGFTSEAIIETIRVVLRNGVYFKRISQKGVGVLHY